MLVFPEKQEELLYAPTYSQEIHSSFGISSLDTVTGPRLPGWDKPASQLRPPESHPPYFLRMP